MTLLLFAFLRLFTNITVIVMMLLLLFAVLVFTLSLSLLLLLLILNPTRKYDGMCAAKVREGDPRVLARTNWGQAVRLWIYVFMQLLLVSPPSSSQLLAVYQDFRLLLLLS